MNSKINFSIIMPVYNEEKAVKSVLEELKAYLNEKKYQTEIIVVNDGSTDQTNKILKSIDNIKLINHPYNKGYGASIKTGVNCAQYNWILLYDGDGQHRPEYIEKLVKYKKDFDMIVGDRIGYKGPIMRQPGKKLLHLVANYLVRQKISDLNSGFRLIKKDLFLKSSHILPSGFSLTTTITLVFFKEELNVKYTPIRINKRKGKSTIRIKDGFNTLMTVFRTITLFSPLKIFLPASFLLLCLSIITSIIQSIPLKKFNISDATVLLFISSLALFFFGLLADQVSAIRRKEK